MILNELRQFIHSTLAPWAHQKGLAQLPSFALEEPPAGIEADVACNLAMVLAKELKTSPHALAMDIQKTLEVQLPSFIEAISIAGAGFLNFRWSMARLQEEVKTILEQGDRYGCSSQGAGRKVLLEFVSANPTGPLHVGHGRGAALGDSLALILNHLGYQVTREFYVNDAGNQVQLLGESLLARVRELQGKPLELPAEGYHGDYVKDVAEEYLKAHPQDWDNVEGAKQFAVERLLKAIETDLADFGVRFDSWFRETSVVQKRLVEKHIQALKDRGCVQEYEDAVWFVAPGEEKSDERDRPSSASKEGSPASAQDGLRDKNRVLKKRDGRWTYFATDIAYHADKLERGYDQLIDIWGADHHGYVARVKGSMQALGYDPNRLHVLLYQLVSLSRGGVPVSMSKRTGDFVMLREVLEEVGRDACRFFFAMRGPNTAFDFDLELAKKHTNDNPVYYVQYAHARICSIFRQAGNVLPMEKANLALLKEREERDLMKRSSFFPQVLMMCAQEESPHPLANYLMALCRQFHHFYDHHRVLGDDVALTTARLALIGAVRQLLKEGLALIGVSAPESM